MSELRDAGYDNLDNITDDTLDVFGNEAVERDDGFFTDDDENVEKRVKLTECYLKIDMDGSGIAEWRKIVRAGNAILENVEVDAPPFVTITPIPVPHKFFGLSVADQAMAIQRVKTSIWRSNLEGLYRTINERTYAVQQNVNMDDLLTNRPGGVVRVKHPTDVGPLQTGRPDLGSGLAMLEQVTTAGENRTGWTRYSQGVGADSLNKTATGINIITNKSEMRVELIARVFAETGVKDLFRMILKLVSMYQDRAEVIKLTNKWITIDPREWHNQFDFVINVGLGSGNRDQVAGQLMQILELQTQGMQLGLADAQKIYHTGAKLLENMGFKNPESFFIDPSQQQGQPQPQEKPDPELIKAQTEAQIKMQEMELKRWQAEQEVELKRERLIAEMNLKRQEMALKMTPQAERKLYAEYDAQNTRFVNDGINPTAGNAATSGAEQIQPSQGDFGEPPMGADIQDPSGGLPQPMGEQQFI
jgi:protein-tyrosine-phosphatase